MNKNKTSKILVNILTLKFRNLLIVIHNNSVYITYIHTVDDRDDDYKKSLLYGCMNVFNNDIWMKRMIKEEIIIRMKKPRSNQTARDHTYINEFYWGVKGVICLIY